MLGSPRASVTLVEYGDYQCPFCGAAQPIVKALLVRFANDLALVFRHFPLTEVHPNAEVAAEAAEFAGAYSRFWQMHDALYENQRALSVQLIQALAQRLGLPEAGLRDAMIARTYAPKVQQDFIGGVRSGVAGTPTFFINGRRHDRGYSFAELTEAIEAAMPASAHL
jgi:protein-disulfide isomerase